MNVPEPRRAGRAPYRAIFTPIFLQRRLAHANERNPRVLTTVDNPRARI